MNKKSLTYRKSILKELLIGKTLSCAEISERTGKSTALVTKTLNEMIADGFVEEKGLAPSSGGRRPLTYSVRPQSLYIIGVAMDQFVTRIAVIDPQLNFAGPVEEIELTLADNENALQELGDAILKAINDSGIDKDKFVGIGIGMPGFIDPHHGANYTFMGRNVAAYIKTKTNLPVFIENDSSTIALAENTFGQAKEETNAMIVNVSWGVGLGMIINGKLFRGNDGFAGEFSHIPLFVNGKLCSCGKTGCLETETSLNFMLAQAEESIKNGKASVLKELLPKAKSHEEKYQAFVKAAQIGDSLTVEIISDAGYNIGRGIAILIHLLNPGKIVISGRCSAAGKIWLAPIHRAINEFCIPRLVSNTKVEVSRLSHTAEMIGAALLVVENIHSCPLEMSKIKCTNSIKI